MTPEVRMNSGGPMRLRQNPPDGSTLALDATTTGQLRLNGCNGVGGQFDLTDDRLVGQEIGPATQIECDRPLMDQDIWLQDVLAAEPVVAVSDTRLVLTADDDVIELQAVGT